MMLLRQDAPPRTRQVWSRLGVATRHRRVGRRLRSCCNRALVDEGEGNGLWTCYRTLQCLLLLLGSLELQVELLLALNWIEKDDAHQPLHGRGRRACGDARRNAE